MPSLNSDLVGRIQRLPKPVRTGEALLPLFEAISNSIHSVQARYHDKVSELGRITVEIPKDDRVGAKLSICIDDNGVGLDSKNYEAFITVDTENKISIGGKGVGRLLWLDCFQNIHVESVYLSQGNPRYRKFDFVLSNGEQIQSYDDQELGHQQAHTGARIAFNGLRDNGYRTHFPTRLGHIFRHITSHFLPTFIGNRSPKIVITCGDDTRTYPGEIDNHIFRKEVIDAVGSAIYGDFKLILLECDRIASSDLQGKHFVHFIAHDRTVKSQAIDGKLGLKFFGPNGDRVFHSCLFGDYLDKNVNQERTAFTFEDSVIEDLVSEICMPRISTFLAAPLTKQKDDQGSILEKIVRTYPSVGFGDVNELQAYVPGGELREDALFGHLSQQRFRRDQKQADKIKGVLGRLKEGKIDKESFSRLLGEASAAIEDAERRSLAEYVVRRKVVIDFLEVLVEKVRDDTKDGSYQREDVLHSFICPMRVNALGEAGLNVMPASHDLWVIDERLTFSQYFSSDVPFNEMCKAYESEQRPDVLLYDRVHGLRQSDGTSKVLLIEFKKPGRTEYRDDENPQLQVESYVRRLLSHGERDVRGRPVRLGADTVFHCFIIADCLGKLADWTYSWGRTADGRGRIYQPRTGFQGTIELIEWDTLISDARERNQAFFDSAGISGASIFSGA